MNKILIGLPISDLQLLLAVSRRIDELNSYERLLQPDELTLVKDTLLDILERYDDGLSAFYAAKGESPSPRV